jgi:nucleoporin GLE1
MQAMVHARAAERQANALKREADEIVRRLAQISIRQAEDENRLGNNWNDQQRMRRAHTEHIIQSEEEKVRARQAEERRAQMEAERLRKEAEAKAAIEELRKREEALKAAQEAEEAKASADRAEAARKEAERLELAKAHALESQSHERDSLGMTTPDQDWREARLALKVRFSALPPINDHSFTTCRQRSNSSRDRSRVSRLTVNRRRLGMKLGARSRQGSAS